MKDEGGRRKAEGGRRKGRNDYGRSDSDFFVVNLFKAIHLTLKTNLSLFRIYFAIRGLHKKNRF
ncbi:MAG: hypothetical protein K940chlam7_00338 [Chlamydiae bacterium]|nr:hypothetical protein [Chlamydiota bacterium]